MAKLKKTKNELKAQREALRRYDRFLPTLELKKQQLQREVRRAEAALRERAKQEEALLERLRPWVKLLSSQPDLATTCGSRRRPGDRQHRRRHRAGTDGAAVCEPHIDYFETPAWLDDAIAVLSELTGSAPGSACSIASAPCSAKSCVSPRSA